MGYKQLDLAKFELIRFTRRIHWQGCVVDSNVYLSTAVKTIVATGSGSSSVIFAVLKLKLQPAERHMKENVMEENKIIYESIDEYTYNFLL